MKKTGKKHTWILGWIAAIVLVLFTGGCGKPKEKNEATQTAVTEEKEVDVSKLKKITVPLSYFQIYETDQLEEYLKGKGAKKVEVDEQNRLASFWMDEDAHGDMISEQKQCMDEKLTEILKDKDTYPSLQEIIYDNQERKFIVEVDGNYNPEQSFVAQVLYGLGNDYQIISGIKEEEVNTTVEFVENGSGRRVHIENNMDMGAEYNGR